MNSDIFSCFKCGFKCVFLKKQLCGHIYCQRCGTKTDLSGQPIDRPKFEKPSTEPSSKLCSYCNSLVDADTIKSHMDTCEMYPIICKLCNGTFIRRSMDIHKQECARQLNGELNWKSKDTMLQASNASMLASSFREFLSLTEFKLSEIAERNKSVRIESAGEEVNLHHNNECCIKMKGIQEKLEETIEKQKKEINLCKQQMFDLEVKYNNEIGKLMALNIKLKVNYDSMKDKFDQQLKDIRNLEKNLEFQAETLTKQQSDQSDKLEKYVKMLTTVITANNVLSKAVDELDIGWRKELALNLSSFQYIWKIEKFTQLEDNAKSGTCPIISSQPFCSSEFGYKLRLQLCPNGDGIGAGTHLSLFLQVLKGPNDAILKWPMEFSADFSVLDQSDNRDHFSAEFKPDLTEYKPCYVKPITEENTACGFPTFISLDKIRSVYLVDDILFLRVDFKIAS
uniref:MATH domain-containing protein n=1 Tax=Strigamia maritima TaxID=126957 RepID=T1IZU6_STRMM